MSDLLLRLALLALWCASMLVVGFILHRRSARSKRFRTIAIELLRSARTSASTDVAIEQRRSAVRGRIHHPLHHPVLYISPDELMPSVVEVDK